MAKTIRITNKQLKRIEEDTFANGIDATSEIPEYPQSKTSVSGKINDADFAKPITTDDVADKMCKNFPWGYGGYFRNIGTNINNPDEIIYEIEYKDNSGDGVPDTYNHKETNVLNDGNDNDDQQVIPYSVEKPLDMLIDAAKDLPPKKMINVLNKLIDSIPSGSFPHSYAKETSLKISSKRR